jgi:glutathione synthase
MADVFRVSVVSKDLDPGLKSVFQKIEGRPLSNAVGVPVVAFSYSGITDPKTLAADLYLYAPIDVSEPELRELTDGKTGLIGYMVHGLKSPEPKECRKVSEGALIHICRSLNIHVREFHGLQFDQTLIENDIVNIINLMRAQESEEHKKYLIKRYLDCLSHLDEVCLIFAEQKCLKRSNECKDNCYESFPVSFVRANLSPEIYDKARSLNLVQNRLWMKMAFDLDFLLEETAELEKQDEFVARFTDIIRKMKQTKSICKYRYAISRNDFMVQDDGRFYQVEFNLIASSLGPISGRHYHSISRICTKFGDLPSPHSKASSFPSTGENEDFLIQSMLAAHKVYGNPKAILVYVCGREKNVFDIFSPAKRLEEEGISMERYSLCDLYSLAQLDDETGKLTVLGKEVAIFYFRDGYMPHQYNENCWKARELIELSRAIKCPDVTLQLINMKYFQYVLNFEKAWKHFGFSEEEFRQSREMFCDILTIRDFGMDTAKMTEYIVSNGGYDAFVLKPQREGGANNYFGDQIKKEIETQTPEHLEAFILMKRIHTRTYSNIHCNWTQLRVRPTMDEIGMYHHNLWENASEISQFPGGTLVRSKISGVDEGGVGMGFAVINSVEVIRNE